MKRLEFALLIFIFTNLCHGNTEDEYLLYEEISRWVTGLFPLANPSSQEEILRIAGDGRIIEGGLEPGASGAGFYNRMFVFEGLQLGALVSQEPDQAAYIYYIKITSPRWKLTNGISVGDPASELEAIQYPTNGRENRYCGEADQCVEFEINDGKIQSILIQLYVG